MIEGTDILQKDPTQYILYRSAVTGPHFWMISWMVTFQNKMNMGNEERAVKAYLYEDFIKRILSWHFGDDHAREMISQLNFANKFVNEYIRNGKELKYQDVLNYYKDNYRTYR